MLDALRCVAAHEESWLVGRFDEMEGRQVRSGVLGCPVCRAEYPVIDGVVRFEPNPAPLPRRDHEPLGEHPNAAVPEEAGMRLAAMLGLVGAGGRIVLSGKWTALGSAVADLVEDLQVLLLNPPGNLQERETISPITAAGAVPVAAGSCRGIAVDALMATPELMHSAARALGARGRLVAPAAAPTPPGVTELVRDDAFWVGERVPDAPPLVSLGRPTVS